MAVGKLLVGLKTLLMNEKFSSIHSYNFEILKLRNGVEV